MKTKLRNLTLGALVGASMGAHAAPVLIPGGDFSNPGGADFSFFESAAGVVSFPASGGNTGGYGLVNNTLGSWGGGLVAPPDNFYPGNLGIPLATLGLTAGQTYTFSMDMINFAGTGTGGLKLEAWDGVGVVNATGDVAASGSSASWATYSWTYTIPANATSIKVVPLLTGASGGSNADSVGFDNLTVNNTPIVPPPVVPVIPNSGFEIQPPADTKWSYFSDGFGLTWNPTGGNPDGNVVINATLPGNYAVLVANNNAPQTLASLGLTAGETYTFQQDMKLISGSSLGGIKVEFVPTASGDRYPTLADIIALPNPVTQWNTYSFQITIPLGCTQIQVVPLWGPGSVVAYDNVRILLPPPPAPLQASIAQGTAVSWVAPSAVNGYQPQESPDGVTWTNLGPMIVGNSVSSVFDSTQAANYQVLESVPAVQDAVYNGGFEEDDGFDFFVAEGWTGVQSQPAERILTDFRTGLASMHIKVVNVASEANGSEIQQNTVNVLDPVNGTITPGNTYDFSFWAKGISSGPSYVQQYKVTWLDGIGNIKGDGGVQGFASPIGVWTNITQSGLVAPAGTVSALIQILGVTGAVAGGEGEVLIDDVTLISDGFGTPTVLTPTPTTAPAVEISWPSMTGQNYQVQSSGDLGSWSDFGGVISGDGSTKSVFDIISGPSKFYKVGELP